MTAAKRRPAWGRSWGRARILNLLSMRTARPFLSPKGIDAMRQITLFLGLMLLAAPAAAQTDSELNLKGAIDFHVHQAPDSVPRAAPADEIASMCKAMGMRGMVMKNHWEPTASLAYMVRRMVPGIEIFGGVTQDLAVGGINP